MKRFAMLALVVCFTVAPIFAAEGEAEGGNLQIWKWANFLVLAGGLGYLIGKKGGPYFAERSTKIRKEMVEAGEVRKEAEARAAEVDRRLANLEAEIATLRAESGKEEEAETGRFGRHTAAEIVKAQANAEQEIAAAGKAAAVKTRAVIGGRQAGQRIR